MSHYLTVFVYRALSQERYKFREIYSDLDSARSRLESIVCEKRKENWKIEVAPDQEIAVVEKGNIVYMASGELADSLDLVMWVISTEKTPRTSDGELLPDHENVTSLLMQAVTTVPINYRIHSVG